MNIRQDEYTNLDQWTKYTSCLTEAWAKLVQRHGGGFASHLVFLFLVFNIRVRSRNRRVSMASIRNSDFSQVEHTIKELTAARLEKASIELESSGKTADPAVNQLLRSLSLYGYRQPMSRESRLTMRRKIKSPDSSLQHSCDLVHARPERYH